MKKRKRHSSKDFVLRYVKKPKVFRKTQHGTVIKKNISYIKTDFIVRCLQNLLRKMIYTFLEQSTLKYIFYEIVITLL